MLCPNSSLVSILLIPPARCLLASIAKHWHGHRLVRLSPLPRTGPTATGPFFMDTVRASSCTHIHPSRDEVPHVHYDPATESIRFFLPKPDFTDNATLSCDNTVHSSHAEDMSAKSLLDDSKETPVDSSTRTFLSNLSKQRDISRSNITSYVQSNDWIQTLSLSHDDLVIHVDDSIIVCNKPSGLLCVPGLHHRELNLLQYVYSTYGLSPAEDQDNPSPDHTAIHEPDTHPTLESHTSSTDRALAYKANESQKDTTMTMENMVVHRLDMDTSGLVVYARNRQALLHLHAAFRSSTTTSHSSTSMTSKHGNRKEQRKEQRRKRKYLREQSSLTQDPSLQITTDTSKDNHPTDTHKDDPYHPDMSKSIQKTYEALLCGHFLKQVYQDLQLSSLPSGEIDFALQRDHRYPPFMRVATSQSEVEAKKVAEGLIHAGWKKKVRKNAKPSKTTFRILSYEYWKDKATDKIDVAMPVTRIELTPWTGRTHQLRVHCAAVGHPIVGDTAYGLAGDAGPYGGMDHNILGPGEVYRCHAVDEPSKQILHLLKIPSISIQESIRSCVKESGQVMCLHARDLTLRHPKTGEMVSFTAPSKF